MIKRRCNAVTRKMMIFLLLCALLLTLFAITLPNCKGSPYFNLSYGGVSLSFSNQKPAILNGQRYIFVGNGFSGNDYEGFNQTIQVYSADSNWQPINLLAATTNVNYGLFFVYTAPTSSLNNLIIICGSMAGLSVNNAFIEAFNTATDSFQNFTQIDRSLASYVTQVTYVASLNEFVLTCAQGGPWANYVLTSTPDQLFTPSNWTILSKLNDTTPGEFSFTYFAKTGYGYAIRWCEYTSNTLYQINMTTGENTVIWSSQPSTSSVVRQYISSDNNYVYFSSSDVNNQWHFWKYDGATLTDMYDTPIIQNPLFEEEQNNANIMPTLSPGIVLISNINQENPESYYALLNATSDSLIETYQGNILAHFSDNTPTFDGANVVLGAESMGDSLPTYIYLLTNVTPLPTNLPTNLPPSSIAISCRTFQTTSSYRVEINGNLTANGAGLGNVPVLLSYSVDGGESWSALTTTTTDGNGNFFAVWFPSVSGTYSLRGEWTGNSSFESTTTTISFVIVPCQMQNVLSISSNSTVSAIDFNSTSNQLTFTVSGQSGTTGYVELYVPKSLMPDITTLKVYLDGNRLNYTSTDFGDSWLVTFVYHHSTHLITMELNSRNSRQSTELNTPQLLEGIAYGAIVTIIVIVILLLILRNKKQKTSLD